MPESDPHRPTRRWTRIAAAALLLLISGAVVNVAVAWGCALRSRVMSQSLQRYAMSTTGAETTVFESSEFFRRSVEPGFIRQDDLIGWERRGRGTRMLRVSRWTYNLPREDLGDYLVERESGWPLLSMHGQCREIDDMYWAMSVPEEWGRQYNFPTYGSNAIAGVFLPLKPHWPGFIINTLFYAPLLWLLFFAPFAARRMLRRRRGQCEKCAYPIGVSAVCTECGAPVGGLLQHLTPKT